MLRWSLLLTCCAVICSGAEPASENLLPAGNFSAGIAPGKTLPSGWEVSPYALRSHVSLEQGEKGTFLKSSDLDAVLGNKNSISFSDFSNIEKVLEFRRILEPEATYMAAKKPKEDLDRLISILRKNYEVMEKSVGKAADFIAADMNFHREIAFASGNEIIGNTIAFVFANTFKWHQQINDYFGFTDGIWFHSEILKALESGNAKKAKNLMERHMTHAIDELNAQKD